MNSGKLVLKIVHVVLEAVTWLYPDSQQVVVFLDFMAGGILGEECLRHLFEVAEKRVESVRGYHSNWSGRLDTWTAITS